MSILSNGMDNALRESGLAEHKRAASPTGPLTNLDPEPQSLRTVLDSPQVPERTKDLIRRELAEINKLARIMSAFGSLGPFGAGDPLQAEAVRAANAALLAIARWRKVRGL